MAGIGDKTALINQILANSNLPVSSAFYKKRRAELEKMTMEQLQAELTKGIVGSYKAPWDRGLNVEQNKEVVAPYVLSEKPTDEPKDKLSPHEKVQTQIKQDLLDCGIFVTKYNTPTLELLTQIYQEAPKNGNREYKEFVQKFQDIIFEYKDKSVKNPDELRKKLLCELNLIFTRHSRRTGKKSSR